jgi:hypothetical protein
MLPNSLITRLYITRGAQLWTGTRVLASAVLAFAGMDPLHLTFAATMLIVGGSVVIGVVDVYRRHERALLENLAISRTALVLFLAAPAILGELSLSLLALFRR